MQIRVHLQRERRCGINGFLGRQNLNNSNAFTKSYKIEIDLLTQNRAQLAYNWMENPFGLCRATCLE